MKGGIEVVHRNHHPDAGGGHMPNVVQHGSFMQREQFRRALGVVRQWSILSGL